MDLHHLIESKRDEILKIASLHGAKRVRLFGSVARGEDDEKSDVDFLVEFEEGRSLLDHASLMNDLEDLLGRSVDVASERGLKSKVRDRILKEASPI